MALGSPNPAHRNEMVTTPVVPDLDNMGACSEQIMSEAHDFALETEPAYDTIGRGNAVKALDAKCDRCVMFRANCVEALTALVDVTAQITHLEKLKPECELLRKQVAESQIQIEENLQSEHRMKSRLAAAEEEAAEAKLRCEAFGRSYDAVFKAAEEGKKHAEEANNWRVKYERTVEVSEKIQEKRRRDKERFDKLLSLASAHQKEVDCVKKENKKLQDELVQLRFAVSKLSGVVQSYVLPLFEIVKETMGSPFFKAEMPETVQNEATRLCSAVQNVFVSSGTISSLLNEGEHDMAAGLETLLSHGSMSTLHEISRSKDAALPVRSSSMEDASGLMDTNISQISDVEADNLLGFGAEAANIAEQVVKAGRGRGKINTRKGRVLKGTSVASTSAITPNPVNLNRCYEDILTSQLRRKGDSCDSARDIFSGVKHLSIHGKKQSSVREQQEAQMKISIKDKVALMKKKEADKAHAIGETSLDGAAEDQIRSEDVLLQDMAPSLKKATAVENSLLREDLQMSSSPSPVSSDSEGDIGDANNDNLPVDSLTIEPTVSFAEHDCEPNIQCEGNCVVNVDETLSSSNVSRFCESSDSHIFKEASVSTITEGPVLPGLPNLTYDAKEGASLKALLASSRSGAETLENCDWEEGEGNGGTLCEIDPPSGAATESHVPDNSLGNQLFENEAVTVVPEKSNAQQEEKSLDSVIAGTAGSLSHGTSQVELSIYPTSSSDAICSYTSSSSSTLVLSDSTKLALGFARRLQVDLKNKLRPISIVGDGKKIKSRSHGSSRADVEMKDTGTLDGSSTSSCFLGSSRDLAIHNHAQLNPLGLRLCTSSSGSFQECTQNYGDSEQNSISDDMRRSGTECGNNVANLMQSLSRDFGLNTKDSTPSCDRSSKLTVSLDNVVSEKTLASAQEVTLENLAAVDQPNKMCFTEAKTLPLIKQTMKEKLESAKRERALDDKCTDGSGTLSLKKPKLHKFGSEASSALSTHNNGQAASVIQVNHNESLDNGPPSRVRSRTGPVAPKRRGPNQAVSKTKELVLISDHSIDDSGDEDRLCMADDAESTEEQHSLQVSADEDSALVLEVSEKKDDDDSTSRERVPLTPNIAQRITQDDIHDDKLPPSLEGRHFCASTQCIGALEAAKRSMPNLGAGPTALQKFNAAMKKQLSKSRVTLKNVVKSASKQSHPLLHSSRSAAISKQSAQKASRMQSCRADPTIDIGKIIKDCSHPSSSTMNKTTTLAPKRTVETTLQKLLHGALMSDQKLEMIRKSLGHNLEAISKMSSKDFAKTMIKCSLHLLSGDMWTIVQRNYRTYDSSNVCNVKEDAFLQIARELAGSDQIWVEYIQQMVATVAVQSANRIHTPRYIRLLMRAFRETDLLTVAEKKEYLRITLTKVFLEDMETAIKATTFALLSPNYDLLDWMKDKKDPFSTLLSLAVTAVQVDGKVLLWAWFQQFSEELPLQVISSQGVQKSFEGLVIQLDEKAEERSRQMKMDNPTPTNIEIDTLSRMAAAYISPTNGAGVNLVLLVEQMVNDALQRIKAALNTRAVKGEKAWSEAYAISSRLHLCIGSTISALTNKDDPLVTQELCELLHREIPRIREFRAELATSAANRPWIKLYSSIVDDVLNLVQVISHCEI